VIAPPSKWLEMRGFIAARDRASKSASFELPLDYPLVLARALGRHANIRRHIAWTNGHFLQTIQ
jgi:hypothetical protein